MKVAGVRELKLELADRSPKELIDLCLRLAKHKKENKELLTYLLFEAHNEEGYIESVKAEISEGFSQMNRSGYYLMKKSVRKILRDAKKHIRFSKKKETEVEILLHFCEEMKNMRPRFSGNIVLANTYYRQVALIRKNISGLHEDLQYDYQEQLEKLT